MSAASGAARASRVWARGAGIRLARVDAIELDADAGLWQALVDGIERGYAGDRPAFPDGSERYLVRSGATTAGVLVVRRDCPERGAAALLAVAIDPSARGRAVGVQALLLAERRLLAEGATRVVARVPRTNGRGLYFMLRAGFTPTAPLPDDDATWFTRADS